MKNHHGGVILLDDHLYGHSDGVGWVCMDFNTGEQIWREREALGKGRDRVTPTACSTASAKTKATWC